MNYNIKKILTSFLSVLGFSFLFTQKASAVCPLCTITVGVGLGLSRWLGIDDTITGLWLGGFFLSTIMWAETWLDKKNIKFKGRMLLNIIGSYSLIIIPLYYSGIMGHPFNTLYGIDKLLLGIIVGSLFFWFGASWYSYLKKKNNGHAHFHFQKIAMPVSPLIILSFVFYFLTK